MQRSSGTNWIQPDAPSHIGTTTPAAIARPGQVVRGEPPEWEVEYNAWAEQRRLQQGYYKQYPAPVRGAGAEIGGRGS
jgi:hypothetical protein